MSDYRSAQIIITVISEEDNPVAGEHRNDAVAYSSSYTFLQTTPITKILLEVKRNLRKLEEDTEL